MFSRTTGGSPALAPTPRRADARCPTRRRSSTGSSRPPTRRCPAEEQLRRTLRSVQGQMYDEVVRRGWFRGSPQQQRRAWQGLGTGLVVARRGVGLVPRLPQRRHRPGRRDGLASRPGRARRRPGGRRPDRPAPRQADGRRAPLRECGAGAVATVSAVPRRRPRRARSSSRRRQDIFSRYLPYAIVFGVADRWAGTSGGRRGGRRGGALARRPRAGTAAPAAASAVRHRHGMDSFSTTAAGTFVSTPGVVRRERVRRRGLLRRWRRRRRRRLLVSDRRVAGRQPTTRSRSPPSTCCWPADRQPLDGAGDRRGDRGLHLHGLDRGHGRPGRRPCRPRRPPA